MSTNEELLTARCRDILYAYIYVCMYTIAKLKIFGQLHYISSILMNY
jgi:hypothetical protein